MSYSEQDQNSWMTAQGWFNDTIKKFDECDTFDQSGVRTPSQNEGYRKRQNLFLTHGREKRFTS